MPRSLLNRNHPDSHWGNLGLWRDASDYPAAAAALALRLGRAAHLGPGVRLLDLGCGAGAQLTVWKRHFGVGPITGVDIDAVALATARSLVAAWPDVDLLIGDAARAAVQGPFDRVLALDCAYHFAPRDDFLRLAARVLEPGGWLAWTDLALPDGARAHHYRWLARLCGIPPGNLQTSAQLECQLQALGFSDIRIERLDADVFGGFAGHALALLGRRPWLLLARGGVKVAITALAARWLQRRRALHYLLVSGQRPASSSSAPH